MAGIGPNFWNEIVRAFPPSGIQLSWDTEGTVTVLCELSDADRAKLDAVIAAHDPLRPDLSGPAKSALDATDITVVRCAEVGVSVPAEWSTYRSALRAIVNGSDVTSKDLPARPGYPTGT